MKEYRNVFFDKVRRHEPVVGFSINFPNPTVIEAVTRGWDYVWLDAQHGQMDYHDLLNCMIATDAANIGTVIRVPGHNFDTLGPVADLNPSAIMIPMVNNKAEAEEIASNLHFAPRGHRSYWNTRMIDRVGDDYYLTQDLMVIAQIESAEGVRNAEEIINTDGIDCLMYGPADLGISYGIKPGTSRHDSELMMNATKKVISASYAAGKYCMFIAGDPSDAKELRELGADIICLGSDNEFLQTGARNMLTGFREKVQF